MIHAFKPSFYLSINFICQSHSLPPLSHGNLTFAHTYNLWDQPLGPRQREPHGALHAPPHPSAGAGSSSNTPYAALGQDEFGLLASFRLRTGKMGGCESHGWLPKLTRPEPGSRKPRGGWLKSCCLQCCNGRHVICFPTLARVETCHLTLDQQFKPQLPGGFAGMSVRWSTDIEPDRSLKLIEIY